MSWEVIIKGSLLRDLHDFLKKEYPFLKDPCECSLRVGLKCPCGKVGFEHEMKHFQRKLERAIKENPEGFTQEFLDGLD